MGPSPELQWLCIAYALVAIGVGWLAATLFNKHLLTHVGNVVGALGACVAALGIAATLNIDSTSGIGAKEVFGIWLASLSLIASGIIMVSLGPSRLKWCYAACGAVCLALNLWTVLLFLWIATVSAGGV